MSSLIQYECKKVNSSRSNQANAEIIGNVKADHWQYNKVDDIKIPLTKLGLFLLFDIIRITVAAGFLWVTCRIDFFLEYCRIMGYYWKAILFNIFLYVTAVSKERRLIYYKSYGYKIFQHHLIFNKFNSLFITVFQCFKHNTRQ